MSSKKEQEAQLDGEVFFAKQPDIIRKTKRRAPIKTAKVEALVDKAVVKEESKEVIRKVSVPKSTVY